MRLNVGEFCSEFISEGAPYAFDSTDQNSMLTSILTQKWIASLVVKHGTHGLISIVPVFLF